MEKDRFLATFGWKNYLLQGKIIKLIQKLAHTKTKQTLERCLTNQLRTRHMIF